MTGALARLKQSVERAGERLGLSLDVSVADDAPAAALARLVARLDPDALVLTGDVTSFGDKRSFELAYRWLEPLLKRGSEQPRKCIVAPGNHDVLAVQLARIADRLASGPWVVQFAASGWTKDVIRAVEDCLRAADMTPQRRLLPGTLAHWIVDPGDGGLLKAFREFAAQPNIVATGSHALPLAGTSEAVVIPFSTVSSDPIFMNQGELRTKELQRIEDELDSLTRRDGGVLRIVAIHHNPLSSPHVGEAREVFAYNGMPGGTAMLRSLQRQSVDLVLHGHQHEHALMQFDFDLRNAGHAYTLGAQSSTARHGAGANLLEIHDVNHATLERYAYRETSGKFEVDESATQELSFERNRPLDHQTQTTRFELKRYVYGDSSGDKFDELCTEALGERSRCVWLSGRKFGNVIKKRLESLAGLLRGGAQLRILVPNPELLRRICAAQADRSGLAGVSGSDLWGRSQHMAQLAQEAQQAVDAFKSFANDLGTAERLLLDVRVSHTVMPFAGIVRDPASPWSKMIVRLFPIGSMGEIEMPVLKLNRRSEEALFAYYCKHFQLLIRSGTSIAGDLGNAGDDLHDGRSS